jgi:hypothetical protein
MYDCCILCTETLPIKPKPDYQCIKCGCKSITLDKCECGCIAFKIADPAYACKMCGEWSEHKYCYGCHIKTWSTIKVIDDSISENKIKAEENKTLCSSLWTHSSLYTCSLCGQKHL